MTNVWIDFKEIKISILFNLDFATNNILLCFSFFFLIIDLYVWIPVTIAQIFDRIAELAIPIGRASKETDAQIEIHQVVAEANTGNSSI